MRNPALVLLLNLCLQASFGQETGIPLAAPATDNGIQNLLLLSNLFGGRLTGLSGLGVPGIGTGGSLNTLPVVGDFQKFNQLLNDKCIVVGSRCKIANSVCTTVVSSIQDVGVCSCKAGFVSSGGVCSANALSFLPDTTSTFGPPDIIIRNGLLNMLRG
ncbi:hypothetical protein BV898_07604 [Hypsibius exemplaris]|uniref:EGF-like domain-containing protein n=1 Tax=Hypsibius exemplaris TaxID=2072580 RepID=A0A1W0WT73_HYPEX|nr:hypothetical protein BV898_07604 [Hypsibius exemplaris]